ncbi:MAG TPA: sugar transferase [Hyphomicrobiaceae bacterium]|nr:sugar transferase [Hyphomicrobiaceae bacterium]
MLCPHHPRTPAAPSPMTLALKRAIDVVASACGLVVLLPVFAVIAFAIKLDSRGPVFFRQERVGRGGRPFRMFKFRSMGVEAAKAGLALTVRADKRVTRVGKFLRASKLDELPQLINVLGGSMSLVGPRPEVPEFMNFYSPEQRAIILSMQPGMTDYATILFRDESSLLDQNNDPVEVYRQQILPVKFSFYHRYSKEIGTLNDLRIILATILLVAVGRVPGALGIEHDLTILPGHKGAKADEQQGIGRQVGMASARTNT